ncbi:unnamed protein product [Urochloa decumbens]|uniref:EXPERA domain-containing protein n=1 Tax=Urochloa decumbens TaxID=240449 RepID=A0ABC8WBF4_9POAL
MATMAIVSKAADAAAAVFSLLIAVAAPLFDSQVVLPRHLYPAPLVSVYQWFAAEFDHYLIADPPPFFRGFVWIALAFLWPVCVANLYGILARRPWVATTSLMAGVFMLTYLSAMFGEMFGFRESKTEAGLVLRAIRCDCCSFSLAWPLLELTGAGCCSFIS